MSKRIERRIFRNMRDANLKYGMIASGDRIAVAMSGGKDSLCLIHMLRQMIIYTPLLFDIVPIYLDLGWGNEMSAIESYCQSLGFPLVQEETNIGRIVFEERKESNPCSLCANLRRGALHRVAKKHGCNKVAMGHHMDDLLATFFMSMLNESRIRIFQANSYLDRSDITLIRPLIHVDQRDIITLVAWLQLEPVKNMCPADGITARQDSTEIVQLIEARHPGAKRSILRSIEKINDHNIYSQ